MSNNELTNFILGNVKGGQFGYSVVTLTEPKMRKTNNPYMGRVKKLELTSQALLGCSYEKAVNRKIEDDTTFKADKPFGMHYVVGNILLESDKVQGKYYLNVMYRPTTKIKVLWLVDGREATKDEIKEIYTFLQLPKPNQKQMDCGISQEDIVLTKRPMLDNIVLIKQGDERVFKNKDIDPQLIQSLYAQ